MTTKQENMLTSVESEAAVLGAMMLDRAVVPIAENILRDEMYFSNLEYRMIYRLLLDINKRNNSGWDIVCFRDELKKRNQLNAVGGVEALVEIANTTPSSANCLYYSNIVLDKYKRRRLCEYADNLKLTVGQGDIEDIFNHAEKDFRAILEEGGKSDAMILLESALDGVNFSDESTYIATGFPSLDNVINGLGKGHLIVVAGRPGMGKTSFMLNIADLISETHPVGFYSLEMTAEDLMQRMICARSGVNLELTRKCYRNSWTEEITARIAVTKSILKQHKICIDETKPLTPDRLRTRIYWLQKKHGVKAVFVDYLQLMRVDGKTTGLYETVTRLSQELKSIALQLEIPIVVGCQLNRAVENREVKRPRLSDLRDSGSIEQDADVVILLNRPGYYKMQAGETGANLNEAEIDIAKNRRGHTMTFQMTFEPGLCKFNEIDITKKPY